MPTASRRTSFTRPSSITSTRVPGSRGERGAPALLAPRDHRVREGAAGLDDDPGEGRIGSDGGSSSRATPPWTGFAAVGFLGSGAAAMPGASLGRPLTRKSSE